MMLEGRFRQGPDIHRRDRTAVILRSGHAFIVYTEKMPVVVGGDRRLFCASRGYPRKERKERKDSDH